VKCETEGLTFLCTHDPGCSKPDRYATYAQYVEIYSSEGLQEIIPDESEPSGFVCTECNAEAHMKASEPIKKSRKEKAGQAKLFEG